MSKKIFCLIILIISISSVAVEIAQNHYLNEVIISDQDERIRSSKDILSFEKKLTRKSNELIRKEKLDTYSNPNFNKTSAPSNWMENDLLAIKVENTKTNISQISRDNPDHRTYCSSTYTDMFDDWITNVTIGSINNTSGQNGSNSYGDYTYLSTDLPTGTLNGLYVTFYSGVYTQHVWAWIDWNRDDIFDEITESYDLGQGADQTLSTYIEVPQGAHMGTTRLRVIEQYNSDPEPCDPHGTIYGETEDYTVNVTSNYNVWTGTVDNNWHNPYNWYYYLVPDATTNVIIPNVTNKCWVWAADAECNNLTVESGTAHDLRIWDQDLTVHGNMNIFGMLTMDHPLGDLEVEGSIYWEASSSAYMSGYSGIWIHGDWIFRYGSNVHLDDGLVSFEGSGGSYLRNFSTNCYFHDIAVYKTGGDWLSISSNTTYDLNINGNFFLQPDAIVYVYSPHSIFLKDDLYNSGYLYCYDGYFFFDGDVQEINENISYSTTTLFHHLVISSTTSTTILNKDISVNNNLTIESGQFIPNDHTISINGYWNNQVGPSAFVEGNGRVIFTGTSSYVFGDENFNILELNKSTYFDLLQIDGDTVTCQHYDWTNGSVSVRLGGEFTAYDLIDNGIYGGWGIDNTGGTINISNYGDWIDLNGYISLTGGTMNVYGGDGPSYWPFEEDASIYMMDGVLDFHDQGIYITNYLSETLTEDITGGTIRTAGGFWGESANFSPDYGTLEFYGSTDANIYTINGCYLNDVIINKSSRENSEVNSRLKSKSSVLIDERSGKPLGDGTRSNTLTQSEFLDINGSLVIDNGILNSDGYNIQIESDWTNNVGDAGFIESTGWVIFDGYSIVAVIHTNETFNNLMHSNASGGIFGLTLMDGINVHVSNNLELHWSTLEMNNASELHVGGDVYIASGAGLNADDGYNIISVGGNWTNENYSNSVYYGFWPGGEIITFDGATDQIINTNAPEEAFTNIIINKAGGDFRPNDNIQIFGGLQILLGDWWDYVAGLTHSWYGNILIEASGNYYPQGTTQFKGIVTQYYENNGGIAMFGDVIIDKSGFLYLNSNMIVFNDHTTTIEEGTLYLNGHIYKATGWVDIKDGANIIVDAGASLSLGHRLFVYTEGQLTTIGEPGNKALVYNDAVGQDYSIEIFGGTISANHTIFEDLATTGLWVHDGSYVDPVNSFNNCSFDGYTSPAGSTWLIIDNNQALSIDNISFPNHPGEPLASNIGKNMGNEQISITNDSGAFTGPLYEYDPYNRIDWLDYVPGLWTGDVSSDWFDPMNWGDFTVPGSASDVIIPAGTPNDPVVNNSIGECQNITIETGASFEIGNSELHVVSIFDNYGHFEMTNSLAKLHADIIYWMTGSTGDVTTGEIHGSVWTWGDANVSLGTGNTVFLDWSLNQYGPLGSFGNLTLYSGDYADGSDPIHVSGNFTVAPGSIWDIKTDMIIDGDWIIENSASLDVIDGAHVVCNSILTLDNELSIYNNSLVTVHGMLNFNSGGFMVIDNSTFVCDFALSSGWINILGGIDMVSGSLEFPDANISFVSGQYISGGTIVAGRSVHTDIPGVFQPTGGKLELIGSGIGHCLGITNSNYLNELLVQRSAPIGVHPGSPLVIQSSVNINSELMLQGNTITVYGDLNINAGGVLDIDDNAVLVMADSKWIHVNNGGVFETAGSAGNEATITHSSGYYYFWVENGGTITAEHTIFEYMRTEGVNVCPGSMVDPIRSFNNCLFQNGIPSGWMLTIHNNQDFTVYNAIFPTNTWSGSYNVFKNSTPGDITFINATGGFEGEDYEFDPFNHVHWYVGLPEIDDLTIQYNAGSDEIELNWTYPIPVDQFKIYRSTDPYDFFGADVFTTTTIGYSEPATGINYFYRVTAENISDNPGSRGNTVSSDLTPWKK